MADLDKMYANRFRLYPGPVREKREVFTRMYEYRLPFKYVNVEVERTCGGGEPHGMELNTVPPGEESTFVYGVKSGAPGGSRRSKSPTSPPNWAVATRRSSGSS